MSAEPAERQGAPSAMRRLWDRLILQGLPGAVVAALSTTSGKHRTQRIRRNQVVRGNLYGMSLVDALSNPEALEKLRRSPGVQQQHREAKDQPSNKGVVPRGRWPRLAVLKP